MTSRGRWSLKNAFEDRSLKKYGNILVGAEVSEVITNFLPRLTLTWVNYKLSLEYQLNYLNAATEVQEEYIGLYLL